MTSALSMDDIDMSHAALQGPARKPKRGGGRPSGGDYRLADGTRVPSVTTILGRYRDPGPLTQWAYRVGIEHGQALGTHGIRPPGLYADRAAEIGHVVHSAAEHLIHGMTPEEAISEALAASDGLDEEKVRQARRAFGAFIDWWEIVTPEVLETEVPLVSEQLRYGGTFDAVARIGRRVCVIDWKVTRRVYTEHKLQLAACAHLWNEHHGDDMQIERAHCLRFGKEDGSFTHEQIVDLPRFFRAFVCLRDAHEIMYGW